MSANEQSVTLDSAAREHGLTAADIWKAAVKVQVLMPVEELEAILGPNPTKDELAAYIVEVALIEKHGAL